MTAENLSASPRLRPACTLTELGNELSNLQDQVGWLDVSGVISEVTATSCRVSGLSHVLRLGDYVEINGHEDAHIAEVIRVDRTTATIKPLDHTGAFGIGTPVRYCRKPTLRPHETWKGRVIDALGRPIDHPAPLTQGLSAVPIDRTPPAAMQRERVGEALVTGVRAVDLFTPLCAGQRIGVFAGSGVGKSTLLAMFARAHQFDATIIALVGERGREVREFMEDVLGDSRDKAVCVVASGDESPMMRKLAPLTAMSVAECFRDQGQKVLLIIDSITRYAHAARDVALAAGDLPVTRGYPPGVFSELPRLLERAGPGEKDTGSITGIFSVLVDGDDHNDPVADNVRGTLDGHIVLDRAIAEQARYPAIDVLTSISRLAQQAHSKEEAAVVMSLREMIARYEDTRDLRAMGGYRPGRDAELDKAVEMVPKIYDALRQSMTAPLSKDPFKEIASALSS